MLRGCFGLFRRLGCLVFWVLLGFGVYQWIIWPDVGRVADHDPRSTAFIDRYRDLEGQTAPLEWRWVDGDAISKELRHAVIVGEDIEFFEHNGFALGELKSAVEDTVRERKPLRGASTITQQLAKNLWLSPSRNPLRKVKEAVLTLQLERELSKERILEVYLNVVEFAPGVYGAEAAALARFDRAAKGLSRRQAAELAACLPSPSSCAPGQEDDAYRDRVERIKRRVKSSDWLGKRLSGSG
jgi:monofunctional biosynthetic peptidoglycan transglycosylase